MVRAVTDMIYTGCPERLNPISKAFIPIIFPMNPLNRIQFVCLKAEVLVLLSASSVQDKVICHHCSGVESSEMFWR